LKDEETISICIEQRRGSADHPLPTADAEQKFRRLAATSLSASDIDDVMNVVQRLERQPDLKQLVSLLVRNVAGQS
jgi:hypothetical protein